MKYIILATLLFISAAQAGGYKNQSIQQELRSTPEMSARCNANINYFERKVFKYSTKVHIGTGEKIKLRYYRDELESWIDYCVNDAADPDFQ